MFKQVDDVLGTYCDDSSLHIKEEDLNDDGQKPSTMDATLRISAITAVARHQHTRTLIIKSAETNEKVDSFPVNERTFPS
jgi:hypothetical protein